MICENCPFYDSDQEFCTQAAAYKYGGAALADWCPLSDKEMEEIDAQILQALSET